MAIRKTLPTVKDLLALADDGCCYTLLNGVLPDVASADGQHRQTLSAAAAVLQADVGRNGFRRIFSGEPGRILRCNPDRVRVLATRLSVRERTPPGSLAVVPDVIVTLTSPPRPANHRRRWAVGGRLVSALTLLQRTVTA